MKDAIDDMENRYSEVQDRHNKECKEILEGYESMGWDDFMALVMEGEERNHDAVNWLLQKLKEYPGYKMIYYQSLGVLYSDVREYRLAEIYLKEAIIMHTDYLYKINDKEMKKELETRKKTCEMTLNSIYALTKRKRVDILEYWTGISLKTKS
jgi:hypothetical protein